jgi:hypothetical protein
MDYHPPLIIESDGTRRQGTVVRPGLDWNLDLRDLELSYFRIDHQTCLHFEDTVIQVGCPFTLTVEGKTHVLDEPEDLGPLLAQYPDTLITGTVDQDGSLHLGFRRGWTIDVLPNPHYEAWQIYGPGKRVVVCPPDGGTLSVWSDDAKS